MGPLNRVTDEFGPRSILLAFIARRACRALLRPPPRALREARLARHLADIRREEGWERPDWYEDLAEADDVGRPL